MRTKRFHRGDLIENNLFGYGIVMKESVTRKRLDDRIDVYIEVYWVNGRIRKLFEAEWEYVKILSKGKQ